MEEAMRFARRNRRLLEAMEDDPVAVFGAPTCPETLVEGEAARAAISPENRTPPALF